MREHAMNQKDERKGSSNHGNMRDPDTLANQASGRSTHNRSQQQQDEAQQARSRSRQDADPYERDVPEPTNRSALGDQSTKR
jgi:hypothetical protein